MHPRTRRAVGVVAGLSLLILGGFVWRYIEATRPLNLSPYKLLGPFELGFFHLSQAVLLLFLGICLERGFTKWSALMLALPYALTISLQAWLIKNLLAVGSSVDVDTFKGLMWMAASELILIYAWILAFPIRVSLDGLSPQRRTLWKRFEVAFPVSLGTLFLIETAQLTYLADAIYTPEMPQLYRSIVQNYVLGALLCLVLKAGPYLWVMAVQRGESLREPTGLQPSDS